MMSFTSSVSLDVTCGPGTSIEKVLFDLPIWVLSVTRISSLSSPEYAFLTTQCELDWLFFFEKLLQFFLFHFTEANETHHCCLI